MREGTQTNCEPPPSAAHPHQAISTQAQNVNQATPTAIPAQTANPLPAPTPSQSATNDDIYMPLAPSTSAHANNSTPADSSATRSNTLSNHKFPNGRPEQQAPVTEQQNVPIPQPPDLPAPDLPLPYRIPPGLVIPPMGGFPVVHGITDRDIRRNVDPQSLALWEGYLDPCLLVYILRDSPDTNSSVKVARVKHAIRAMMDCPSLTVAAPGYISNGWSPNKPIYPLFVAGISEAQRDFLLNQPCWSLPTITFFTFPITATVTTYIMTLEGFSIEASNESNAKVEAIVRNTLRNDPDIERFLTQYRDAFPNDVTVEEAIELVLDNLTVNGLDIKISGEEVTVYRVYAYPPTIDTSTLESWISLLRDKKYISISYGMATARENREHFGCNNCKAADHPSGLCPYTRILNLPVEERKQSVNKYDKPMNWNGQPSNRGSTRGSPRGLRRGNNRGRKGQGT